MSTESTRHAGLRQARLEFCNILKYPISHGYRSLFLLLLDPLALLTRFNIYDSITRSRQATLRPFLFLHQVLHDAGDFQVYHDRIHEGAYSS